jgi:hypothetical protein
VRIEPIWSIGALREASFGITIIVRVVTFAFLEKNGHGRFEAYDGGDSRSVCISGGRNGPVDPGATVTVQGEVIR